MVKKLESLRCNDILTPSSSVKFHLVILQMIELLCWRLSLARLYLLVSLVWRLQDLLLHI